MDSGIVVQFFLGILWALGCALFVTFLLEFREDRSTHSNYSPRGNSDRQTSSGRERIATTETRHYSVK